MNITPRQITLLLIYSLCSSGRALSCPQGHRVEITATGSSLCVECESGISFMSVENHTLTKCFECTKTKDPGLEIVARNCNTTHDTEILCRQGYFRYKARTFIEKDRCERCLKCENSLRVCSGYHDTVCCPSDHNAVTVTADISICLKRPIFCAQGQFFYSGTQACLPCPAGTFMHESNHSKTNCLKCEELSGNSTFFSVIISECNATSPTVFGCKEGYFRDIHQGPLTVEVKCLPCQKCERKVRDCDIFHDTACFRNDDNVTGNSLNQLKDMTMDDRLQHPSYSGPFPKCGKGQYLFTNLTDGSFSCQECTNYTSTQESLQARSLNQSTTAYISLCPPEDNPQEEFRIYSICLFVLATLVDILYIFLYSRTFLKKNPFSFRNRNSSKLEKLSRMIGTVGIDLHFVLIFVHLFGILCEVGVINMEEKTLWDFTIAVIVLSLLVFFVNAILFLFAKRVLSVNIFKRRLPDDTNSIITDDDEQVVLELTEI